MKNKKVIVLIIFGLLLFFSYLFSLRSQLIEAKTNQENYKNKIESLSEVNESQSLQVDQAFIKRFFNYTDTNQRYSGIKSFMTSRGFESTHPSGASLPKKAAKVETAANNLKAFEHRESRTKTEFINEFDLSTEYNGVSSTNSVLVRTKLVYVDRKGWLVDEVEFINQSKE